MSMLIKGNVMASVKHLLLMFCVSIISFNISCRSTTKKIFDASAIGCDPTKIEQTHFFKTAHHTRIAVLKHINGKEFIVKQEQRKSLRSHLTVAREELGVYVAHSIKVFTNHIKAIPDHCEFPGKSDNTVPATLHTFVPGIKVSTLPKELRPFKVCIQQTVKPSVPKHKWGLTRTIIQNMAQHPDLPCIVALDTFIANADRHRGNFFYDLKTDHYFVIDLESSFNKNLASYACTLIKTMLSNEKLSLSLAELEALDLYRSTLKKLIKLHTPEKLYNKLIEYAIRNGLLAKINRHALFTTTKPYRKAINENYTSCIELVELLDQLLQKHDFTAKK